MRKSFYTKELLESVVPECRSVAQVIEKLGRKQAGGTSALVKRKLNEYSIDYSHFTGQGWNVGSAALNKKSWEKILVLAPEGSYRARALQLRRAMVDYGMDYACESCSLSGEWNGLPLTLEVDHRDGNWLDSRPENVRFLCPNCHSQQPNQHKKK